MTKEEILNKAIYIQFPEQKSNAFPNAIPDTYKEYNVDVVNKLPPANGMLYSAWTENEHHYTTEYHRKIVIPTIVKLLKLNYKSWKFKWPQRKSGDFDISIPVPKSNFTFSATCFNNSLTETVDYNGLTHGYLCKTDYHNTFRYPHRCSQIINNSVDNNKKLLIIGDSQLIPSIAFLCCFYKEVWYIDNRDSINIYTHFENIYFDDVLIQFFSQDRSFYLEKPFI